MNVSAMKLIELKSIKSSYKLEITPRQKLTLIELSDQHKSRLIHISEGKNLKYFELESSVI